MSSPVADVARRPFGVNYYGFITAEIGLGGAARGGIAALKSAGVPVNLVNVRTGRRSEDQTYGKVADRLLGEKYRVNVIHQNADMVADFIGVFGEESLAGCRNIGYWLWELAAFRPDWHVHFNRFDEIWTPSEFCRTAIAAVSPVPVVRIPLVVEGLEGRATHPRSHFGIPEGIFVFLFIFDMASFTSRKNPDALIEAYRWAFGGSTETLLLLKLTNPHFDSEGLRRMRREAEGLNVRFIAEYMSGAEMASLQMAADCYVSPHRSEGFGLTMAEAMSLGKPVIATRYSSNLDFMNDRNSYLVDCRLVEIGSDCGPYPKGYVWAEPSIDHLSELMKSVRADAAGRAEKGACAREDVARELSAARVGQMMMARLRDTGVAG